MTDLVTVNEFARSLDRSPRSIYDARYRGSDLPPAITIGGRLYLHQDDINDWVSKKRDVARAEMAERSRSTTRPIALAQPSSKNQTKKSREPRAFEHDRDSLETSLSKGMPYDE